MIRLPKGTALVGLVVLASLGLAAPAQAEVSAETKYIFNTFSFLVHGFLVMWMAAGFSMLESGLVRSKNTATICLKNLSLYCVAGFTFYLIGYNLMYTDVGKFAGSIVFFWQSDDSAARAGEFADATYATSSDWYFQMVFVATAASIVSGTLAERIKLWPFLAFVTVLTAVIYPLQGSWVWGGGWLSDLGFSDFAGSTLVHSVGGWAALTGALILGPRLGKFSAKGRINPIPGNNLSLATLGTFILWMGWFGFNAGSAVAANGSAGMAMAVTQIATATAALTWMFAEWITHKKPSVLGIASGAVAGLVAITPASGYVGPGGALAIGAAAGVICFWGATALKRRLGYDDSLDVFAVHGLGGITGAMLTGVLALEAVGGTPGAIEGNFGQIWLQFYGVAATVIYCGVVSFVLLKIIGAVIPLRVSEEDEREGLDIRLHGESVS